MISAALARPARSAASLMRRPRAVFTASISFASGGGRRHSANAGDFRDDVDALDVHLVVSSYCFFQVANQYTFGYLFDRDLLAPERRDHLRAIIGDVVVAWLTAR